MFFTHPRESLTFNYERQLYPVDGVECADPRVAHAMTLDVDEYGNVDVYKRQGMGWSLSAPSITRKTDKGLPQYRDRVGPPEYRDFSEPDVFILSGAEDLVPVLRRERDGVWVNEEFERDGYCVKLYRPRIEGMFARIEKWTRIEDGEDVYKRQAHRVVTFDSGVATFTVGCKQAFPTHLSRLVDGT